MSKIKTQPTELEKIFVNHVFNKGLISKIYKELIQHNNQKKSEKFNLKMDRRTK